MDEIKSYLSFSIGGESFAANVGHIRKIIVYKRVTKIPSTPDFMLGVINLMGEVLPVVDARVKLGMSETEITSSTCILDVEVTIDNQEYSIGLLVESVSEVIQIEKEDIKEPPSIGTAIENDYLHGIYSVGEKFIMILNIDEIFKTDEVLSMSELTASA